MFRTLTLADALSVVERMREWDRRCVRAAMGEIDDASFAVNRWQTNGPAWSLLENGEPVAIGGVSIANQWTGVFWLVAVDGMPCNSWRKLIRHTRTVLANATDPRHPQFMHRVEAHCLSEWTEANEFARRLGFEFEGTRRRAGSAGEDIQVWSKVKPS